MEKVIYMYMSPIKFKEVLGTLQNACYVTDKTYTYASMSNMDLILMFTRK